MAELDFNAAHYFPIQPGEEPNEYSVWIELCKRMDREVAEARIQWRASVQERDRIYKELKEKSDVLRSKCMQLEARQKPLPPKKG